MLGVAYVNAALSAINFGWYAYNGSAISLTAAVFSGLVALIGGLGDR